MFEYVCTHMDTYLLFKSFKELLKSYQNSR